MVFLGTAGGPNPTRAAVASPPALVGDRDVLLTDAQRDVAMPRSSAARGMPYAARCNCTDQRQLGVLDTSGP